MHKNFASALFLLLFLHISSVSASERMARIIGGEPADSSAWPWMAGLVYKRSISTNEVFCGASLIAKDWVLTAAHCVDDVGSASFDVIINQAHLNLDTVNGERIHVDSVLSHPLYDRDSLDNDLALIKLATPSKNSPVNILAPFSSQDNTGKPGIALGWGSTSWPLLRYPVDLQQVELPIIDNPRCDAVMGGITDDMLCAGDGLGERDTCFGDSGGPLAVFDTESNSWRQAGITSWGFDCAEPNFFGVYTRLKNYSKLISDHICSAAETPAPVSLKLEVNGNTVSASWNALDQG